MTLPKKGSRLIEIDGSYYRFKVTGNDMIIDVLIEQVNVNGQKLIATFDYHNELTGHEIKPQEQVVTPSTIRLLVLHALKNGWEPEAMGKPKYCVNGEHAVPLQWKT